MQKASAPEISTWRDADPQLIPPGAPYQGPARPDFIPFGVGLVALAFTPTCTPERV
jgi:hypothetical protein